MYLMEYILKENVNTFEVKSDPKYFTEYDP